MFTREFNFTFCTHNNKILIAARVQAALALLMYFEKIDEPGDEASS